MRAKPRIALLVALCGVSPLPGEAPLHFDLASRKARSFADDAPLVFDVDGDGRRDTLVPRVMQLRRRYIDGATPFAGGEVERFIAFSLDTAAGRSVATVLQFRFGTENGGYEAYHLGPVGDANGDGRDDLVFRVGGDLAEETVVLLDRGDVFEARTTGLLRCSCGIDEKLDLVDGERPGGHVVGRWDRSLERFVGDELAWVVGSFASVRSSLDDGAAIVARLIGGTAIRVLAMGPEASRPEGWLAVAVDGKRGWISERLVERQSPLARQ